MFSQPVTARFWQKHTVRCGQQKSNPPHPPSADKRTSAATRPPLRGRATGLHQRQARGPRGAHPQHHPEVTPSPLPPARPRPPQAGPEARIRAPARRGTCPITRQRAARFALPAARRPSIASGPAAAPARGQGAVPPAARYRYPRSARPGLSLPCSPLPVAPGARALRTPATSLTAAHGGARSFVCPLRLGTSVPLRRASRASPRVAGRLQGGCGRDRRGVRRGRAVTCSGCGPPPALPAERPPCALGRGVASPAGRLRGGVDGGEDGDLDSAAVARGADPRAASSPSVSARRWEGGDKGGRAVATAAAAARSPLRRRRQSASKAPPAPGGNVPGPAATPAGPSLSERSGALSRRRAAGQGRAASCRPASCRRPPHAVLL